MEINLSILKRWALLLKPYVKAKNTNHVQRGMRVIAKQGGVVHLRTTNGSAMCNVKTSIIADHDLDYCVDWIPFLGVAQTSHAEKVNVKFLKSGIRLQTLDSNTKLESRKPFGFSDGMPKIAARRKMVSTIMPFESLKVLDYSSKEDPLDPEAGLMTLTANSVAYTFCHLSLGRVPLNLADETVYVRFKDVSPLSKTRQESVTTYLEDDAFTIVGEIRWVRMPRSKPSKDFATAFDDIMSKLSVDKGVSVERKALEVAAYRIKKSLGEVDIEFRIDGNKVKLTVMSEGAGTHQEEQATKNGIGHCMAGTRVNLLYDAARALRHPELTFMIPDLEISDSKFLAMTDGEFIQAIALRPEHSLRKAE